MRRPHKAETYGTLIILLKSKLVIRAACNGTEKAPVIINAALFLSMRRDSCAVIHETSAEIHGTS